MLNAEYFAEYLCPVGCPDHSPRPLPSFPLHYCQIEDVGVTVSSIMLCILLLAEGKGTPISLCLNLIHDDVKNKNIWSLNCCC